MNGIPKLGVIYVPVFKTLYIGDVNANQSFKADLEFHNTSFEEVESKLELLEPKSEDELIKVVGSRSHMNQKTIDFIDNIKKDDKVEIVSKGSSLKFCLIAEGLADIYPRFAPTMEWDTASGQAICNALGIKVISQETNQSLLYNKESLLNPWFVVSKP